MSESMRKSRLLILGSGPAGYTAAIYASRAGLRPILVTGPQKGGQLMKTLAVDNWPGEINGVLGPVLMDDFLQHALRFDVEVIEDTIESVHLGSSPFRLQSKSTFYECDSLIIATGASAKSLGLSSEIQFMGRGVSGCATCDGYFFRNSVVAVVGGGNTAVEETLHLAKFTKKVYLIHRRSEFRAEEILLKRISELVEQGKVELVLNRQVIEILGDDANGVSRIVLQNSEGRDVRQLEAKGIFVAIGHQPNTSLFNGQMHLVDGYIATNPDGTGSITSTSIPGVFAAGDVQDHVYRQAITSAASGCMAALDAQRYLDVL